MRQFFIQLKRAYHRWCLKNFIAHYDMIVCSYDEATNGYIAKHKYWNVSDTNERYHVFVDSRGKIVMRYLTGNIFNK